MKHFRYLVIPALLIFGLSVAPASVKMPAGPMTGELGPAGCPIASVDGKVEQIDLDGQRIIFTLKGHDKPVAAEVGSDTKYRVPGFKRKELKTDGLSKIPANARIKVKFCSETGEVTEVKVKKEKKKKTTT